MKMLNRKVNHCTVCILFSSHFEIAIETKESTAGLPGTLSVIIFSEVISFIISWILSPLRSPDAFSLCGGGGVLVTLPLSYPNYGKGIRTHNRQGGAKQHQAKQHTTFYGMSHYGVIRNSHPVFYLLPFARFLIREDFQCWMHHIFNVQRTIIQI